MAKIDWLKGVAVKDAWLVDKEGRESPFPSIASVAPGAAQGAPQIVSQPIRTPTVTLRFNVVEGDALSRLLMPQGERLRLAYQREIEAAFAANDLYALMARKDLGDDFARLTRDPVILDDIGMMLLEKLEEVSQFHAEAVVTYGPDGALNVSGRLGEIFNPDVNLIRAELARTAAHLFRNPDIPVTRTRPWHLRLPFRLIAALATIDLDPQPDIENAAMVGAAICGLYKIAMTQQKEAARE